MHRDIIQAVQDGASVVAGKAATVQDVVAEKAATVQEVVTEKAATVKDVVVDKAATVQEVVADKADAVAARLHDTGVEARSVVAERLRESEDVLLAARENAGEATDRTLRRFGGWLAEGRIGERLGLAPTRRRVPGWVLALGAVAVGFAAARLLAQRDVGGAWTDLDDQDGREDWGGDAGGGRSDAEGSLEAPRAPLEGTILIALQRDPRTADLTDLNVNVVDSTVFVRGVVPLGYDESALRAVVEGVEGVTDVDLQVSSVR